MAFHDVARRVFRSAVLGFAVGVSVAILVALIQVLLPNLNSTLSQIPWSKELVLIVWPSSLLLLATGDGDWGIPLVAMSFNGIHYSALFVVCQVLRLRRIEHHEGRAGKG